MLTDKERIEVLNRRLGESDGKISRMVDLLLDLHSELFVVRDELSLERKVSEDRKETINTLLNVISKIAEYFKIEDEFGDTYSDICDKILAEIENSKKAPRKDTICENSYKGQK